MFFVFFNVLFNFLKGGQEAEISWLKNGKVLDTKKKKDKHLKVSKDAKDNTCTLEISKTIPEDEGTYTVSAKDANGEITHAIKLTVTSKLDESQSPQILDIPQAVNVFTGDVLTIGVSVFGKLEVYYWHVLPLTILMKWCCVHTREMMFSNRH